MSSVKCNGKEVERQTFIELYLGKKLFTVLSTPAEIQFLALFYGIDATEEETIVHKSPLTIEEIMKSNDTSKERIRKTIRSGRKKLQRYINSQIKRV